MNLVVLTGRVYFHRYGDIRLINSFRQKYKKIFSYDKALAYVTRPVLATQALIDWLLASLG